MNVDSVELLAANPFPGLRSYEPEEADRFFGRQEQIEALVRRLAQVPLIAVSGASGCGKSSLVKAGLLNELKRRHEEDDDTEWLPVVMRPGSRPLAHLAAALAQGLQPDAALAGVDVDADGLDALQRRIGSLYGRLRLGGLALVEIMRQARLPRGTRVLIVVDQFEEIFRFKQMGVPEEASAFVTLLLKAAADRNSGVSVALTLRSDTLGGCADFPGLPEAVSAGGYLVPRLTRTQRRQAIEGPIHLRGKKIAPRLVQKLLSDVSSDFDDLPVMQHVLSRAWRHWAQQGDVERPIDLEDYNAVGGADDALSQHADEALASLGALGQPSSSGGPSVVERVFRALTERLAGGTEVRRPVELRELCEVCGDGTRQSAEDVIQVVERYRRADTAFLVPPDFVELTGDAVIDISHESLMRQWKKLRKWLDAESESGRIYERLAATAADEAHGLARRLWQPELGVNQAWRDLQRPNPAWARRYEGDFWQAMSFLDDSLADAVARETSRRQRLRGGVAALLVSLLGLVTATVGWLVSDANSAWELDYQAEKSLDRLKVFSQMLEALDEAQRVPPDAGKLDGLCHDLRSRNDNPDWRTWQIWLICGGEQPSASLPRSYDPGTNEDNRLAGKDATALHARLTVLRQIRMGDIQTAIDAMRKLDGGSALIAMLDLQQVADMQPLSLREERLRLAQGVNKNSFTGDPLPSLPRPDFCAKAENGLYGFTHPVHIGIATARCNGAKLTVDQQRMLLTYANWQSKRRSFWSAAHEPAEEDEPPQLADGTSATAATPFRFDLIEDPTASAFRAEWVYWRVAKNTIRPDSKLASIKERAREIVIQYQFHLLALLIPPLWWGVRWLRKKMGVRFVARPHPLRLGAAAVTDSLTAAALAFMAGTLVDSTMTFSGGGSGNAPAFTGLGVGLGYLWFCDALFLKYRRSIGKILFGLRPVMLSGDDRRTKGASSSVKRNFFVPFGLVVQFLVLTVVLSVSGLLSALAGMLGLFSLWFWVFKGRPVGDRWAGTVVIDADSDESLAVDAPPRYVLPTESPGAALEAAAAGQGDDGAAAGPAAGGLRSA